MRSEKGQSLVEFALVIPFLLLLLFGIIDFGRTFHVYLTLDHAGREAARAASVGHSDAEGVAVDNAASINLTRDQVDVLNPATSGSDVKITITYPITFLTPVIKNIVGPFTLTNNTVMRIE